ncbi:MAG: hypothetical protein WCL11_17935 [Verrucomicrobiota bacterium]
MSQDQLDQDTSNDAVYEPRTEGYGKLRLYGLVGQVLRELNPLLDQLEEFWPRMPKVDANGNSECPFAEDMYRKKAGLEKKISEKVAVLRDMRDDIARELERCKRNLARISVDAGKLQTRGAVKQYDKGFCVQENEYLEAKWQLDEVDEALLRAQATLEASRRKAYPIPLSEDWKPSGLPASASSFPEPRGQTRLDREVGDLISLGRM